MSTLERLKQLETANAHGVLKYELLEAELKRAKAKIKRLQRQLEAVMSKDQDEEGE